MAASWGVLLVLSCVTLNYGALEIPLGISCSVSFCFVSVWYRRQNKKKRFSFAVQTQYSLEITEGVCALYNLLEEPVGILCRPVLGLKELQAAAAAVQLFQAHRSTTAQLT